MFVLTSGRFEVAIVHDGALPAATVLFGLRPAGAVSSALRRPGLVRGTRGEMGCWYDRPIM